MDLRHSLYSVFAHYCEGVFLVKIKPGRPLGTSSGKTLTRAEMLKRNGPLKTGAFDLPGDFVHMVPCNDTILHA